MVFPSNHISEPRASVSLIVCVRVVAFAKCIAFIVVNFTNEFINMQTYREENR